MSDYVNIFFLTPLLLYIAILAGSFLYLAMFTSFTGSYPSAPAAIGRALGVMVLGQLVSFYILWYLLSYPLAPLISLFNNPNLDFLHEIIGIIFCTLAGYLSMRTNEDTQSMNMTLVAIVGLLPQGLITLINVNQGTSQYVALFLFIPAIVTGGYLYKKLSRKRQESE